METLSTTEVARGSARGAAPGRQRRGQPAAPFLWLRIILGIEPDRGKLVLNPDVSKQCGKIVMRGVHASGQRST
jgi:hypothetical protein